MHVFVLSWCPLPALVYVCVCKRVVQCVCVSQHERAHHLHRGRVRALPAKEGHWEHQSEPYHRASLHRRCHIVVPCHTTVDVLREEASAAGAGGKGEGDRRGG